MGVSILMKKINKKDFFTIPNILCYIRILLIPVFIYTYLNASSTKEYILSVSIVALGALTDLFDGMIARKFNQITELGKFLDPLSDKLTQGALIFVLTARYSLMWLVVGLFILKEGFMAVIGLAMLKHNGRKLDGAMWFGKFCTALLYVVMVFLLLFPQIPLWAANSLMLLCALVMVMTLASYIPVFAAMWKLPRKEDES